MTTGIRGRILTWLVIAIVPVLLVALVSTSIVENRLTSRVENDLENVRRLEASRITQELASYSNDAERLARATYVMMFTEQVQLARNGELDGSVNIGGQAGFDEIDPDASEPLNQVANAIRSASLGAGTAIVEARVVGTSGDTLGESSGYRWEPRSRSLVQGVLDGDGARFGLAYRVAENDDRVGLVTPILNPAGEIVGALLTEVGIRPIVELLVAHESFGDTTEAHLAQRGVDGNAQFITRLRFEPDAAFSGLLIAGPLAPISQSLDAVGGKVIHGTDYRGIESVFAIETIEETGWGLAVKVDADEAFGLARSIRTLVLLGSLLAISALIVGWALVLRPLVRRIRDTAVAAEGVAAGDYTSRIDDRAHDEIGEVARGIDRLAADLEFDIRIRNDAESRLRYQATHDELTDIFNRQHMTSVIRQALSSSEDQSVSVLFLDLDDFKLINDLWGHALGDEVLAAVANRLRRLVGDDVMISRWGGDEFTVVLRNADTATLNALAQRVRNLFSEPVNTSVGPHPLACSVGVATAYHGDDLDQLLHDADARMFEEKQANRKSRMIEPDTARLIESALADGRLEVHYQPIVSLVSPRETRMEAVEALVRIRDNTGALRQPDEFLPEVLSHRYAREIDRTIALMALRDLAKWQDAGLVSSKFLLALNLSPASTRDPALCAALLQATSAAGVDPKSVVLELSEEGEDLDAVMVFELRDAGFQLAIDDLGLKRSNMDRLSRGGVDIAKLDRCWLDDPQVLGALVAACLSKEVTVIGEGVETMEQLELLYDHGVRLCQGYLISRPQSAATLEELLTTGKVER